MASHFVWPEFKLIPRIVFRPFVIIISSGIERSIHEWQLICGLYSFCGQEELNWGTEGGRGGAMEINILWDFN